MKPKITNANDGEAPPKVSEEYLRRNDLHAKAVGVAAGLGTAIDRLGNHAKPPKWLVGLLWQELRKAGDVADELAAHRDEIGRYEE